MTALSDVTIGVTSFLRYGFLRNAVADIQRNFCDCPLLVADDSDSGYPPSPPDDTLFFPFDSGLGVKRNALVKATKTKYFLLGTDDFLFDMVAREGVEKMFEVLEAHPEIDVAGGRFNKNIYEGYLDYVPGEYIREIPLPSSDIRYSKNPDSYRVDLTANYFLARTSSIALWEESMKIGGEHVMWFLKMKQQGKIVVWVPSAEIGVQEWKLGYEDERYGKFRQRCWDGHRRMKELLGIKRYIGFDGSVT